MKLLTVGAVLVVAAAAVTWTRVEYPSAGPGLTVENGGVVQVVAAERVTAEMCLPELWSPTEYPAAVGQVIHSLSTTTADPARVAKDVTGTLGVLQAGVHALVAGIRNDPTPATVTVLETRAAEVSQKQVQAQQVVAAACAPCPATGVQPAVAVGGAGADVARAHAAAAGFTGQALETMVGIAGAESSFDPTATNQNTDAARSVDYGMWQINRHWHPEKFSMGDWRDPAVNARMAKAVYDEAGGSFTPWTTYKSGAYLAYMDSTPPLVSVATVAPPVMAAGAPLGTGCGLGAVAAGADPVAAGAVAPAGGKTVQDLVEFARWAEAQGVRVSENAALGDPPRPGAHSAEGFHYRFGGSGAVDMNTRAGKSLAEQRELAPIAMEAQRRGFGVIFLRARGDHDGHLHVDIGTHRDVGDLSGLLGPVPASV